MNKLRISELLLSSDLERRAKRIPFHPKTTLLRGNNQTGKSSVLKSIYWTFGAEPARVHPRWVAADVMALVKFDVGGTRYELFRKGSQFAIFDDQKRLLKSFQRVTHGLGPYLAQLFSFGLKLTSKAKEVLTPPPAYFFLPYYVDQDVGWATNWASFSRLDQFADWRSSVIEYHTGIKPNDFYLAKAACQAAGDDLKKAEANTAVIDDVRKRMQHETRTAEFDIDIDAFQEQVNELLTECAILLKSEEELKERLRDLNNARVLIDTRRAIVQHALEEIGADYRFATEKLTEDVVDCPTCGAVYQNSFIERFEIAKDEDRLADMLLQLREEQNGVDLEIGKVTKEFQDRHRETARVQELLATKKKEVSLAMVLQSEGRKEVAAIFGAKLEESRQQEARFRQLAEKYREDMKMFEDKRRRAAILAFYQDRMRSFLHALNVDNLPEKSYKSIVCRVGELGSEQPRALLAYYFSILHTMRQYSSSTFCPVVLDAPNQQGQDDIRLPLMLGFIQNNLPPDAQLVLGVEKTLGVQFDGSIIDLPERYKLLQESDYDEIRAELRPMLTQVLA